MLDSENDKNVLGITTILHYTLRNLTKLKPRLNTALQDYTLLDKTDVNFTRFNLAQSFYVDSPCFVQPLVCWSNNLYKKCRNGQKLFFHYLCLI